MSDIREMCCLDMGKCEFCPFINLCQIITLNDDEQPFGEIIDKLNLILKEVNKTMEELSDENE